MIVSGKQHHQNSIVVGDITFEKVPNFKYFEVDVNEKENSYEEINQQITARIKWYFSLVSDNTVLARPIVCIVCIWEQ